MMKLFSPLTKNCTLLTFIAFASLCFSAQILAQKSLKIKDYYPIADGNEWRYVAPKGWKDGDYISRIVLDKNNFASTFSIDGRWDAPTIGYTFNTFKHYDATKAAKLLRIENGNIYYVAEEMPKRQSFVLFEKPILWFTKNVKIGQKLNETRKFTQYFANGRVSKGIFKITQKITKRVSVKTTVRKFKKALRIESETYWELGDGRKARSINVYHYAKKVGVVKASARFIIINKDGKEIINRLINTDLKNAKVNERWLFKNPSK